jgi:hypothetical protein
VKITLDEALSLVKEEHRKRDELRRLRAVWRSTPRFPGPFSDGGPELPAAGEAILKVDGEEHRVSWEELQEVE